MPVSNYPGGFSSGVTVRGLSLMNTYSGNLFWVSSTGGSNGNKGTFDRPFATIDYAIGKCTASQGDIIMVKAGHVETPLVSITMDVIGVAIIGLGWGTMRPKITFGALAAEVAMSAASGYISNIVFGLGTVATTVTNAINITADGCTVEGCETQVHATSQFTNHITATDAQYVEIRDCKIKSLHTAGSTSGIVLDGCDDLVLVGNYVDGHFGEHGVDNTTPGSVDEILRAYIGHNTVINRSVTAGDLALELDDAATGIFEHNSIIGGLAGMSANINIGNMCNIESYVSDSSGVDIYGLRVGTVAA
jgi:hypothetical protein